MPEPLQSQENNTKMAVLGIVTQLNLKVCLHMPFPHAENAVCCVLIIFTLVWTNQRNYLEIATQCGKRMWKRHV